MTKRKKQVKSNLTNAFLYILIGLLFCVFKAGMMNVLFSVVGALLIAKGVLDVLAKNVTSGVIAAVAGIAVILLGWQMVEIALVILGVIILIKSVQNIWEMMKRSRTVLELVGAILAAAIGLLLIFSGWKMVDLIFIIVGLALILDGGLALYKELGKK